LRRSGLRPDDGGVQRLERLLGIALLLSARRRLKAEDLAQEFGVSLRTVYRDVRALQEAGFPVAGAAGDGYLLPPGSQLRPLALEPGEAAALALGARLLESLADAELRDELRSASHKLAAVLGPSAVRRVRDRESTVLLPQLVPRDPGPLSVLLKAVDAREVVRVRYHGVARGMASEREIEPLGVVRLGEVWLVPAYCRLREDLRVFRIDRMLKAVPTGERFVPRPGLSLEDFVRRKEQEPDMPMSRPS
jgi:predicted DNA-binding transcriptional regulator YafY